MNKDNHSAASHSLAETDLNTLVSHRFRISATTTLESTYKVFRDTDVTCLAVVSPDDELLGMCMKRDVGMLLGHRFGNALFSRSSISQHLHPEPMCIHTQQSISEVLQIVFSRRDLYFFDDVMLLDDHRRFLGFIPVQDLIRLQTGFLVEKVTQLEKTTHELNLQKQQMDQELAMSGRLQLAMLPHAPPVIQPVEHGDIASVDIQARLIPTGEVGGDFYYYFKTSDHSFGLLICDVMGHGVRSAMVTAILRARMGNLQHHIQDPAALLTSLNQQVYKMFNHLDDVIFVTAVCAHFDLTHQTVTLSCAGHQSPILQRLHHPSKELATPRHEAIGAALGFFSDSQYANLVAPITAGDTFIFYTDGIIEAQNPNTEEFGIERMLTALNTLRSDGSSILEPLIQKARDFGQDHAFNDDICLIAVRFREKHANSEATPEPVLQSTL